ncbi:MAG: ATP-binding protein [Bacteroidales bacterium]|nr:ATP-binding protein [Bacteroidales bacterium]
MSDIFSVSNLGPILNAEVEFGDLTILTGPQATGKTLFLESFALFCNSKYIAYDFLESNGISSDTKTFLDYYYGENMHNIIQTNTVFNFLNRIYSPNNLSTEISENIKMWMQQKYPLNFDVVLPNAYYIPAQRSLAISEGRIKTSDDFINSPYSLVKFCKFLQDYVKKNQTELLKDKIKDFEFFKASKINMKRNAGSPRLEMTVDNQTVPYMAWSTGQRELAPLLMSIEYFEKYTPKSYIIIEEPELGLHPRAIIEFMLTVLQIMQTGTKVIISTHSSTPLDFVWTIKHLKENGAKTSELSKMFDFKIKDKSVFDNIFEKTFKTYYFAPDKKTKKVTTKDISSLDVYSEDEEIASWGGMSLSADRAGSIVSKF